MKYARDRGDNNLMTEQNSGSKWIKQVGALSYTETWSANITIQ